MLYRLKKNHKYVLVGFSNFLLFIKVIHYNFYRYYHYYYCILCTHILWYDICNITVGIRVVVVVL